MELNELIMLSASNLLPDLLKCLGDRPEAYRIAITQANKLWKEVLRKGALNASSE